MNSTLKKGNYNCNVLNCGDGSCVHFYINHSCPHCGCQLVHVTVNDVVFCSGDFNQCGYETTISQVSNIKPGDDIKDHELAELVNEITKNVRAICPGAPQSLREVIAKAIKSKI